MRSIILGTGILYKIIYKNWLHDNKVLENNIIDNVFYNVIIY